MQRLSFSADPRFFQVAFQSIFLSYGIIYLHWHADWQHYIFTLGGCILFNYLAESIIRKKIMPLLGKQGWQLWGFSVLISALSLCLLLKTNFWYISLLAAFLTVASKYIIRYKGKHIFNPSAFAIVATILLTDEAWLSPGQWGAGMVLFFTVISFGFIVVTKVQKLDISLAFLFTYVGLLFWRQSIYLNWPADFFIHSVSTGSLLLFTFFMISDPRTSPNHPVARIIWAVLIASVSFYLSAFYWKNNTPIWVLVASAPLVPLLDKLFKANSFSWTSPLTPLQGERRSTNIKSFNLITQTKLKIMKPFMKKGTALIILLSMLGHEAMAFCGFYVAKADGTLKNKTSQVILVRDGNRSVVTMYNDFKGNFKDFAMVVPVPVVLKKADIKVVDQAIFNTLNDYSKPRLVEYYDQNPCMEYELNDATAKSLSGKAPGVTIRGFSSLKREDKVKIEAQYIVGEYDILILSAKESTGLKDWLTENGYKIPASAEEVLEPYIKSNMKFFVVKVNEKELKKLNSDFLRPIQISFNSPKFMLPIRLGMANADGDQDMIVYAFTKKGRIETANYRTISLPTGNNVPLFVKNNFGNFYANLFQNQWQKEGKSLAMLEYAWDVSPKNFVKCDPCVATAPSTQDLLTAGVWWLGRDWMDYSDVNEDVSTDYSDNVFFTRLHLRYNRDKFPQDLVFLTTPNKENYQARYVVHHPATGSFNCEAGKKYLKELKQRRSDELDALAYLTGKKYEDWDVVTNEEDEAKTNLNGASYNAVAAETKTTNNKNTGTIVFASVALVGLVLAGIRRKK